MVFIIILLVISLILNIVLSLVLYDIFKEQNKKIELEREDALRSLEGGFSIGTKDGSIF